MIAVDDVATACATLAECAKALRQSEANKVVGLVVARNQSIKNLKHVGILREVN